MVMEKFTGGPKDQVRLGFKLQGHAIHITLYIVQAHNQTFLEGGSKSGMVAHMKWAL